MLALEIGPSRIIFGGLTLQSTTVEGNEGLFVFPETIRSSSLPKDAFTSEQDIDSDAPDMFALLTAKGPTRFSNSNNHEWLGLRKATVDPGATIVGTLSFLFTTIDRGPGQNAFARLRALGDTSLARDQASEKFPTRIGIALFKARDLA
tara:strand:- start:88 stop:534 length:447 start_codon:yes stop_codon:yes gene_type:complete